MAMSEIDELLAKNTELAAGYGKGGLKSPPKCRMAVVACMDARLDIYKILGITEGMPTLSVMAEE